MVKWLKEQKKPASEVVQEALERLMKEEKEEKEERRRTPIELQKCYICGEPAYAYVSVSFKSEPVCKKHYWQGIMNPMAKCKCGQEWLYDSSYGLTCPKCHFRHSEETLWTCSNCGMKWAKELGSTCPRCGENI
jgi:DNA-directed RNA polymerase subunit RPC12/RpoP